METQPTVEPFQPYAGLHTIHIYEAVDGPQGLFIMMVNRRRTLPDPEPVRQKIFPGTERTAGGGTKTGSAESAQHYN